MKSNPSKSKLLSSIFFGLLFLLSSAMNYAEAGRKTHSSNLNWLNFSLKGGFAHSESRSGMVDVMAEIQFILSSNIRGSFGIGYLSDFDGMHMGGSVGGMSGGMMGGMTGSFSGHNHDFKVVPLTFSLYYLLPVNPKLDVFMTGGGGYYLGSFRDISTQRENAFGPHAGIGFDFKVADRIAIVAEGIYRFINLKNFTSELHPGFRDGAQSEEHEEGFWHFHHDHGDWHFHEEHEVQDQMMMENSFYNISLNGFSIRAGIKFGF